MLTPQAQEVLEKYQVRKSRREKREFRTLVRTWAEEAGWAVTEERRALSGTNLILGDPDRAKVLLTAHYDTQAVLPIPNFITPRNLGWYLAYQLVLVLPMLAIVAAVAAATVLIGVLLPFLDSVLLGIFGAYGGLLFVVWWMFFGKANRHTANDNTSGVVTLIETALALPPEFRDGVCLVFFDNEERGMLGSNSFAHRHPQTKKNALVLNFDCVGDGDSLQFFPTTALKKEPQTLEALRAAFPGGEGKEVEVVKGFGFYPSDNASFTRACGVCALKRSRVWGYYMDRIHTSGDTCCDPRNIALLVRGNLDLTKTVS